ncbi:MAG: RNA ligase family protein [Prevotella sp.]
MIRFKKYSSIENSFNAEFMDKVKAEMPSDLMYVVQEKVHGANTSFLCDGNDVCFAKRTSVLADDEKFYDYEQILAEYRERVMALYADIKSNVEDIVSVSVFGELFGGRYPHKDVKADKAMTLIQKGVYYTPVHEFYGFDIYLNKADGERYLPVEETNALFEKHGFFYAKTLFTGTLEECLSYPNTFQSKIPEWLGLPEIVDNICEGVVIRPVVPMYLSNRDRVLIKNKNARFAEKKEMKKRNKLFKEPIPYSEGLKALVAEVEAYVNVNRLANVISHIGEVSFPKDIGKVLGMFCKDVLEDFLKEHGGEYSGLDKCEQKSLNKEVNKLCSTVLTEEYLSKA